MDGLRALLGCRGRVWPVTVERATLCAEYADGAVTRGEVEVDEGHDRGHRLTRIWLDPAVRIHPAVDEAIGAFDAVIIGPGSFFTSLMPTLLVDGVAERLRSVRGPIILVTNLLTEGRGMGGFTAADAVGWVSRTIGRPVDVVIANHGYPSAEVLARYQAEYKEPLAMGTMPDGCEVVTGEFWLSDIARHHRQRLTYAVWAVLSRRLLG